LSNQTAELLKSQYSFANSSLPVILQRLGDTPRILGSYPHIMNFEVPLKCRMDNHSHTHTHTHSCVCAQKKCNLKIT